MIKNRITQFLLLLFLVTVSFFSFSKYSSYSLKNDISNLNADLIEVEINHTYELLFDSDDNNTIETDSSFAYSRLNLFFNSKKIRLSTSNQNKKTTFEIWLFKTPPPAFALKST